MMSALLENEKTSCANRVLSGKPIAIHREPLNSGGLNTCNLPVRQVIFKETNGKTCQGKILNQLIYNNIHKVSLNGVAR